MEFLVSSTCSVISSTVVHPIDVIKTNYQISRFTHNRQWNRPNIITITKNIYKNQGTSGFYRGLGATLLTYPLFWGIYFQTKQYSFEPTNINYVNKFSMAYGSSVIATTIVNPLFVIKVRTQSETFHNTTKRSYVNIIKTIYQKEGVFGFMKGWSSTQLSSIKLGVQMPLYDHLKEKQYDPITSSTVSKLSVSTLFYPFDLIRTNQRNSVKKKPISEYVKWIFMRDGVRGFYKGVGLYNLVTAPNFILMMFFKELIDSKSK